MRDYFMDVWYGMNKGTRTISSGPINGLVDSEVHPGSIWRSSMCRAIPYCGVLQFVMLLGNRRLDRWRLFKYWFPMDDFGSTYFYASVALILSTPRDSISTPYSPSTELPKRSTFKIIASVASPVDPIYLLSLLPTRRLSICNRAVRLSMM